MVISIKLQLKTNVRASSNLITKMFKSARRQRKSHKMTEFLFKWWKPTRLFSKIAHWPNSFTETTLVLFEAQSNHRYWVRKHKQEHLTSIVDHQLAKRQSVSRQLFSVLADNCAFREAEPHKEYREETKLWWSRSPATYRRFGAIMSKPGSHRKQLLSNKKVVLHMTNNTGLCLANGTLFI